jgi:hypothetical protein
MTKVFSLAFALALLLTQPPTLLAQEATSQQSWAAVEALAAGDKLRVETKSGEQIEGKHTGLSDSALTLSRKGRTMSLNRTDVRRIYRLGGGSRVKSALIGTGVGAGLGVGGAAAALGATGGSDETGAFIAIVSLLGAGIGAAVGAAAGKGTKRTLIYESK